MSDPAQSNPATHPAYPLPVSPHADRAWLEHALGWQRHVAAGRIGSGGGMGAELLARIRRNEAVLLGATPSFPSEQRRR